MPLKIRKALTDDIEQLTKLINSAYRDQLSRSWTTEKSFVQGNRITIQQLERDLEQENFQLLIGESEQGLMVGCIGLTFNEDTVEIATFAIDPKVQNSGYGREMLGFAENYVPNHHPDASQFIMYVLDVRVELISYYERRGYYRTGCIEAYPIEAEVGQPLVPIQLIEMKKAIL